MIEKKVTFDVVKVYGCYRSDALIEEDKTNHTIDIAVPSIEDKHKIY